MYAVNGREVAVGKCRLHLHEAQLIEGRRADP